MKLGLIDYLKGMDFELRKLCCEIDDCNKSPVGEILTYPRSIDTLGYLICEEHYLTLEKVKGENERHT